MYIFYFKVKLPWPPVHIINKHTIWMFAFICFTNIGCLETQVKLTKTCIEKILDWQYLHVM